MCFWDGFYLWLGLCPALLKLTHELIGAFLVVVVSLDKGRLVGIQSSARFAHEGMFLHKVAAPGFLNCTPSFLYAGSFSGDNFALPAARTSSVAPPFPTQLSGAPLPVRRFESSWEKSNNIGVTCLLPEVSCCIAWVGSTWHVLAVELHLKWVSNEHFRCRCWQMGRVSVGSSSSAGVLLGKGPELVVLQCSGYPGFQSNCFHAYHKYISFWKLSRVWEMQMTKCSGEG